MHKHADHIPFQISRILLQQISSHCASPQKNDHHFSSFWMGGYLLGWIKLSPSHCGVVKVGCESGKNSLPNASRSWAKPSRSIHHPREMSNFPPPKTKTAWCLKTPTGKKWLIFCNPLICREKAHPNICSFALPWKHHLPLAKPPNNLRYVQWRAYRVGPPNVHPAMPQFRGDKLTVTAGPWFFVFWGGKYPQG